MDKLNEAKNLIEQAYKILYFIRKDTFKIETLTVSCHDLLLQALAAEADYAAKQKTAKEIGDAFTEAYEELH
jgi:hypothetical protein